MGDCIFGLVGKDYVLMAGDLSTYQSADTAALRLANDRARATDPDLIDRVRVVCPARRCAVHHRL
jgi:hypothetical protein